MSMFSPCSPIFSGFTPLYDDEASILTKYAAEKLKAKKIAFFYQNDAYGKGGLDGCKDRMKALKMQLVEEVSTEPGEKDLSSQILRLKKSGADVVIMWVNPTSAVIALKTAATVGFKP